MALTDSDDAIDGLEIVDPHFHLWDLQRASYPWLEGPPTPRYHGDDVPLRRDYLLEDYLRDLGPVRLLGAVHVDAGAADPLDEALWVAELATASGLPSAHVAGVDLRRPDAASYLDEIAAIPVVRGVRQILNWHPDPYFSHTATPDMARHDGWLRNFGRLAGLGLSFDLQVFPHQLDEVVALAHRFESTRFVLDHVAMPIERDTAGLSAWRQGLDRLAACPNVVCKISALGTLDHDWTTRSLRPLVIGAIDAFGPQRSMFASNFPVDSLYSTLPALYGAFATIVTDYSGDERRALFVETAASAYGLELPARDEACLR